MGGSRGPATSAECHQRRSTLRGVGGVRRALPSPLRLLTGQLFDHTSRSDSEILTRPETRCDGGVVQVSLSRLNHWLPGAEAPPEVGTRCSRFLFWTFDQGEGGSCVGRPRRCGRNARRLWCMMARCRVLPLRAWHGRGSRCPGSAVRRRAARQGPRPGGALAPPPAGGGRGAGRQGYRERYREI